jgi:hypothetical protein
MENECPKYAINSIRNNSHHFWQTIKMKCTEI